jgi:hypothetical protein
MDNVVGVAVGNATQHLLNNLGCVLLRKLSACCNFIEEFSSRAKLRDEVVPFRILIKFIKSKNVGMVLSA